MTRGNSHIYTVTFNPAVDYVLQLDGSLRMGEVNRNRSEDFQWGGKGINVSTMLTRLGLPSTALGFVAGFTGDGLEAGLRQMGVKTDFIHLPAGMTRVNVKISAGQETEINGIGPEITDEAMSRLYAKLCEIPAQSVLVLAGSIPACLSQNTYRDILEKLQGREILTAVDATGCLLTNVLEYHPFLIKPNNHELEEIAGQVLPDTRALAEAAADLQRRGARNVLVSRAAQGALLLDETGRLHEMPAPRGTPRNSVGAGDSMVAGFLAGYLETGDYGQALRLGTAAGSASAFCLGLAEKADIMQLLDTMNE